jgi:septal ring factor EnvC (AmiA/AmiB activator)
MADRGPLPKELQKKRVTVEIKRLESMIEAQELEVMEKEEQIERLKDNIKASKNEIKTQESNLINIDKDEGSEEIDG